MNNVRVGVGVCIIKDGKVLLGERLSKHGQNTYSFPGGHLEMGEHWFDTAKREVLEEAGIEIDNLEFLGITNDCFSDEKHYITIFVTARYKSGVITNCEPDKCKGWDWYTLDNLPKNKFLALENLLVSDDLKKLEKILKKYKL